MTRSNDPRLSRQLDIGEFRQAFSKFKRILCAPKKEGGCPDRLAEMNAYSDIIDDLFNTFGGTHFYNYHNTFSRKAEQYEAKGIPVSWDKQDTQTYLKLFSGLRSSTCQHCSSSAHSSNFCPTTSTRSSFSSPSPSQPQLVQGPPQQWSLNANHSWTPNHTASKSWSPNTIPTVPLNNGRQPDPQLPGLRPPRRNDHSSNKYHNGKELCMNFNARGCTSTHYFNKNVVHLCDRCFSTDHPGFKCPIHQQQ